METVKSPAEHRVVLRNASWGTYERLIKERGEGRLPRFSYDRGALEIMSPSTEHESAAYCLELLVAVFCEETGVSLYNARSATFKRRDLEGGFEPDAGFYVQNEGLVLGEAGANLDPDPPPDLVIEIDITGPSLSKLPVYARMGVPEVWRHDGERVTIFVLREGGYEEAPESAVLPPLSDAAISRFVEESSSLSSTAWMRRMRGWARGRQRP